MAVPPRPQGQSRPKSSSPAERAEEFAAHQRRLKEEAAERRLTASERPPSTPRRPQGGTNRNR